MKFLQIIVGGSGFFWFLVFVGVFCFFWYFVGAMYHIPLSFVSLQRSQSQQLVNFPSCMWCYINLTHLICGEASSLHFLSELTVISSCRSKFETKSSNQAVGIQQEKFWFLLLCVSTKVSKYTTSSLIPASQVR